MKNVEDMTVEELRAEMERIRGERRGIGVVRRKVARERRITSARMEKRKTNKMIEEDNADWV